MVEIVLTREQASQLSDWNQTVVLRSPEGRLIGYVMQESAEEIEAIKARRNESGKWYTTAEVLDHLRAK